MRASVHQCIGADAAGVTRRSNWRHRTLINEREPDLRPPNCRRRYYRSHHGSIQVDIGRVDTPRLATDQ